MCGITELDDWVRRSSIRCRGTCCRVIQGAPLLEVGLAWWAASGRVGNKLLVIVSGVMGLGCSKSGSRPEASSLRQPTNVGRGETNREGKND
eukprot:361241-Chlamydomonas_euryale.AAC.6